MRESNKEPRSRRQALKLSLLALAMVPLAFAAGAAQAAWPEKPIRLVVGFPPGGPVDTHARILAEKLQPILGQSIVLDYKAGAAGNIGSDEGQSRQAELRVGRQRRHFASHARNVQAGVGDLYRPYSL